jgi:hypothetical protein
VVQLDVNDGRGDKQRELTSPCHALMVVRGIIVDRCLHPPVVWGRPLARRGRCHLSGQVLDDATGGDVPRASEYNVERLATLVVTGLIVRMAIYSIEVPLGFLEPHSVLLVLFRGLPFACPPTGRKACHHRAAALAARGTVPRAS